ncbi:MAG: TIGR00282 family metallophosphoesterase [Firmicutes bacterium]|nr:TIGR00282 family metallophosphoesterase [Bacillota bacterium]
MNIMLIGDIVGRPGRRIVKELLPGLIDEHQLDLVIANGENAAGGSGITGELAEELFSSGIDVITTGNHVWDKKEIIPYLETEEKIIRPANYPPGTPGQGSLVITVNRNSRIGIINLSGRVFLNALDCPFRKADTLIEQIKQQTPVIIVDFHAEATSEKQAFGWYLDGRVSAVVGTHTHIQTADERILPGETAYITDVGMTGPRDSVLGVKTEMVIQRFITQLPNRFEVAGGVNQLNAVVVGVNAANGRAHFIKRIQRYL